MRENADNEIELERRNIELLSPLLVGRVAMVNFDARWKLI